MDMFLKNITFLNCFVKMSAKIIFLFKVGGAGAGAGLKIMPEPDQFCPGPIPWLS